MLQLISQLLNFFDPKALQSSSMALRCQLQSLPHRIFPTSTLSLRMFNVNEKARAALNHLRFEKNPERILDICRAAALSPESHLDRVAYSKAISRLKESNHSERIRELVKDSINKPDCKSERFVSHFIILYGKGGLVSDAVKLFDEMPEMGITRNIKTLNSLLFSCLLAKDYAEMKRVFLEFPKKYGLDPNLDTYNIVLEGYCESGNATMAHSLLAEMEKNGVKPNVKTFSTVIAGFYTEQKFSDVGKMMELMKRYGIHPGISIYNVRIRSLCKLKRSAEAKALFDGILSRGMKPNCATYGHLVYGFCREGKLDMAKRLFEEMVERGLEPESECYFTLIYYLCQGKDFGAAFRVCKLCMSKGWVPNFSTMISLVEGLVSLKKVDEAREIIRQVKGKFPRNADRWSEIEKGLPM